GDRLPRQRGAGDRDRPPRRHPGSGQGSAGARARTEAPDRGAGAAPLPRNGGPPDGGKIHLGGKCPPGARSAGDCRAMSRLTPASPLPAAAHGRHGAAAIGTFRDLAPLLLALAMRLATGPTANLSYAVIAAYALMGRPHLIRALAMSWLFTMLSPGIAPEASIASIGRYLVLFSAAFSAFIHSSMMSRQPRLHTFTFATILLGMFLIGHSFLFSPVMDVSVLKALSWTLAMATLISAWTGLSPLERHQVERQIFQGLALILLLSLPLTVAPLGYLRNGSGFQGILNHPQAFGPTMGLLGAWAAARMLGERKPSW